MAGYSIFISYAHGDEALKNALTEQLRGLQRQGLIDPWDDRCIDAGDTWRAEIDTALDSCHLALLLVSPAFIASDFINTVELSRLLERRDRDGIRVVPMILRPCAWKHEEPIASLQARPKNGKAIITFPADDGARDQAWSDIVDEIARWAKTHRQAPGPSCVTLPTSPERPNTRREPPMLPTRIPEPDKFRRKALASHREADPGHRFHRHAAFGCERGQLRRTGCGGLSHQRAGQGADGPRPSAARAARVVPQLPGQ